MGIITCLTPDVSSVISKLQKEILNVLSEALSSMQSFNFKVSQCLCSAFLLCCVSVYMIKKDVEEEDAGLEA